MTDETIDYRQVHDNVWGDDFPLTPLECWFVMRGWSVRPKNRVNVDTMMTMPGHLELVNGYIVLSEG